MVSAAVAGPHAVEAAIVAALALSAATARLEISPFLERMEAPEETPAGVVVETAGTATRAALVELAALGALLTAVGVIVPYAMFSVACVLLSSGAMWIGAALVARYRELRWFHRQLLVSRRRRRFTTPARTREIHIHARPRQHGAAARDPAAPRRAQ